MHYSSEIRLREAFTVVKRRWLSIATTNNAVKQGCQSQMDGGPNKKFSYKPRAGLFECSLKIF
jgi:hypothetical protein